jgi:C4-type Zn-finger protein
MKTLYAPQAAKYLTRSCPKCAGYFGVIVSRLPHRSSIRAVSGWCKRCNYEIAWALLVRERPRTKPVRRYRAQRDREDRRL